MKYSYINIPILYFGGRLIAKSITRPQKIIAPITTNQAFIIISFHNLYQALPEGIEPPVFALSGRRSATELHAYKHMRKLRFSAMHASNPIMHNTYRSLPMWKTSQYLFVSLFWGPLLTFYRSKTPSPGAVAKLEKFR